MSGRVVKRAYRYRFYPTPQQADLLNRTLGSVRYGCNRALAERSRAWTQEQRRVTFAETCRMLTAWKAGPDTAWLYEVSNVALQQGLQHLQNAYVSFWAKRARYPRFKSKRKSRASATVSPGLGAREAASSAPASRRVDIQAFQGLAGASCDAEVSPLCGGSLAGWGGPVE